MVCFICVPPSAGLDRLPGRQAKRSVGLGLCQCQPEIRRAVCVFVIGRGELVRWVQVHDLPRRHSQVTPQIINSHTSKATPQTRESQSTAYKSHPTALTSHATSHQSHNPNVPKSYPNHT